MKKQITEINDTRKSVSVTVPAEKMQALEKEVVVSFQKEAKIKGFRPGKAPEKTVRAKYKQAISEQLGNKVRAAAFDVIQEDKELDIYGIADIQGEVESADAEQTLVFTVDLQPKIELPEYTGISVEAPMVNVEEHEVQGVINQILTQRAEYNKVERAAEKGDYVKLSYEGTIDGQAIEEILPNKPIYSKQTITWEEAGAEETPGVRAIVDGIVGMAADEKKEVTMEFPADFEEAELAGKSAVYQVEVKEVREKTLPPIDEAFLVSLKVESEDALKERILEDLKARKEQEGSGQQRQQVIDFLNENTNFSIPQVAKDNEAQAILGDFVQQQINHGVPQAELEKNREQLIEQATAAAEVNVKTRFILNKIAEEEKLEISDEDLKQAVIRESMQRRIAPQEFVQQIQKDRSIIQRIRQDCLVNKTLDFLLEKANVTYVEAEATSAAPAA